MANSRAAEPIATVDVTMLNSVRWGPIRQMFPAFVEEVELGRYLKQLLADSRCKRFAIQPHPGADGKPSRHVFDVVVLED
jgi:hypothetical protein